MSKRKLGIKGGEAFVESLYVMWEVSSESKQPLHCKCATLSMSSG